MIKLIIAYNLLGAIMNITEYECLERKVASLSPGETFWLTAKLADSYENQILSEVQKVPVGKSVKAYREEFQECNLKLEHIEIQKEMATFEDLNHLRTWINTQIEDPILAEECVELMQKKGWIDLGDGKIGIPLKKLLVRLKAT